MTNQERMEKIVSLAKRRGFVFPGSEIYGGMANSWDYGPLGVELKNNIKKLWWKKFVQMRDDVVGIDAALVMNPKVWEASGHIATFTDPLVECKKCHSRYRADQIPPLPNPSRLEQGRKSIPTRSSDPRGGGESFISPDHSTSPNPSFPSPALSGRGQGEGVCLNCGGKDFTEAKQFNLMFKTFIGPAEEQANVAYFRPETAQAMFTNFKNVLDTTRKKIPFGIAQIGAAFRNEITPGNFIFRTREFEQMEIEYFFKKPETDSEWQEQFEHWQKEMWAWMTEDLKLSKENIHELEVPAEDRAHYSKRTIDFEYDFPFGKKELYGLAYRTDFDLTNHMKASGQDLQYRDPESGEAYVPHVIEPTWGVNRTFLALLCEHYDDSDPQHIILRLPPKLAPFTAAVFPLLKNKPELVAKAREIHSSLTTSHSPLGLIAWDDRGNVGKRYFSQDEIGTPFCVTVDFDTLEDSSVTVRSRDTGMQERIAIDRLQEYILTNLK